MKVQSLQGPNFGKIYYGANPKTLTKTQKDVVEDIEYELEQANLVSTLEKRNYHVYMEPSKNGYSIDLAFVKDAGVYKDGSFHYDKIVVIGGFAQNINKLKGAFKNLANTYSVDTLKSCFYNFLKNEAKGKYKRQVNYL